MKRKDAKEAGVKDEFLAAKRELKSAKANLNKETMAFNKVESLIDDLKKGDMQLFNDVDKLTDEGGINDVDVFIFATDFNGNRNDGRWKGGDTDANFGTKHQDDEIEYMGVRSTARGDNTVVIRIDYLANARHLAHEFGHTNFRLNIQLNILTGTLNILVNITKVVMAKVIHRELLQRLQRRNFFTYLLSAPGQIILLCMIRSYCCLLLLAVLLT